MAMLVACALLGALAAPAAAAVSPTVSLADARRVFVDDDNSATFVVVSLRYPAPLAFRGVPLDDPSGLAGLGASPRVCLGSGGCFCGSEWLAGLQGAVSLTCSGVIFSSVANATYADCQAPPTAAPAPPDWVMLPRPTARDPWRSLFAEFDLVEHKHAVDASVLTLALVSEMETEGFTYEFDSGRPTLDDLIGDRCEITFSPDLRQASNDEELAPVVDFDEFDPDCRFADFSSVAAEVQSAIDQVGAVTDLDELDLKRWSVGAISTLDDWLACELVAVSKLERTEQSGDFTTIRCLAEAGTQDYLSDPCCNPMLQYSQCCAPRTLTVSIPAFPSVLDGATDQCRSEEPSEALLQDLAFTLSSINDPSSGCLAARQAVASDELWTEFRAFVSDCEDILWSSAPCRSDDDCFTRCSSGVCLPPIEDTEATYFACYLDRINPSLESLLRDSWGVSVAAPDDVFLQAFRDNLQDTNCVGITARDLVYPQQPDGTRSYRFVDEDTCLEDVGCNWSPIDESDCLFRTEPFCGYCDGPFCVELTRGRGCYVYAESIEECEDLIGGEVDFFTGGQLFCRLLDVDSEAECLPRDSCLPLPPAEELAGPNESCFLGGGFCLRRDLATQELCEIPDDSFVCVNGTTDDYGLLWHPQLANGDGLCTVPVFGEVACAEVGGTFFRGRIWSEGFFDTQEKCERGACTTGDLIYIFEDDREMCNELEGCDHFCTSCRSQGSFNTLCYLPGADECECQRRGGYFIEEVQLCWFDFEEEACLETPGAVWNSCFELSIDECRACAEGDLSCEVLQPIMGCGVFLNSDCANKDECELQGSCPDNVFFNEALCGSYRNLFFENQARGDCYLSCVLPFQLDVEGSPFCPPLSSTSALGCVDYTLGPIQCAARGGVLTSKAVTEQECLDHGQRCLARDGERLARPQDDCELCGGTFTDAFQWAPAQYRAAKLATNTRWMEPEFLPYNEFRPTLNVTKAEAAIDNALALRFSSAYRTEMLCRFGAVLDSVRLFACDCGVDPDNAPSRCFNDDVRIVQVGSQRFCAGIADSLQLSQSVLEIYATSVPLETNCLLVDISIVSAGQFRRTQQDLLSSESLSGSAATTSRNPFAVIKYRGRIVGQLVGDGLLLSWDAADGDLGEVGLCTARRGDISLDRAFSTYDFAILDDNQEFVVAELDVEYDDDTASVCVQNLNVTSGQAVFPILRVRNFRNKSSKDKAQFALLYVIVVLDLMLAVWAMAQFCVLMLLRGPLVSVPKLSKFFLCAFLTMRAAYLLLVENGSLEDATGWQVYCLYDFPLLLYFTSYSILVFHWADITTSTAARDNRFLGRMGPVFVLSNAAMYALFFVFAIVYSQTGSGALITIYRLFLISITLAVATGFLFYGFRLLKGMTALGSKDRSETAQKVIRKITRVTLVCSLAMLAQSFYITFASVGTEFGFSNNLNVQLLPFLLTETLPCALLIVTVSSRKAAASASSAASRGKPLLSTGASRAEASRPGEESFRA